MRMIDLIADEEEIVLEGEKIAEFADMLEKLRPLLGDSLDTARIRTARRIVGKRNGTRTGRDWSYEYAEAAPA